MIVVWTNDEKRFDSGFVMYTHKHLFEKITVYVGVHYKSRIKPLLIIGPNYYHLLSGLLQ